MPVARSYNANKLTESPVLVVTSLRPRERPLLSVRQRRIADFCSAEAGRKHRKETNRRAARKRTAVTNCIAAAAVTATASCNVWNRGHLDLPLMEQSKEEAVLLDDVKVLFPARDILYSDSEVALLSAGSSWCIGVTGKPSTPPNDPPPSRISTISTLCPSLEDKVPPRPCGRVGLVDGTGVGDRYLNKPPEDFVPSDEVVSNIDQIEREEVQKPYRQVWHSMWEHQVDRKSVASSKSTKTSKPVDRFAIERPLEQVTASANNVCSARNPERKQRVGVSHPSPMAQMRMTYHSKTMNRPWGRPINQRVPSTGTRVAQRKMSAMKGEHLVGDCESVFERAPRTRRCEPTRRKTGVPRVVVTTASRPMTAVSPERPDALSVAHPRSAPANPKPRTSESFNNRVSRLSTMAKPMDRPRFSVPLRASRVPMDLFFKEMNSPKLKLSKKDTDASGGLPIKYRGATWVTNALEQPFPALNKDVEPCRDAGQSIYFNVPEKSCTATMRNSRRLYNRPSMNVDESNPSLSYSTSFQTDAECMPISKNLLNDPSPFHLKPRTSLRPQHASRFVERGPHRKMSSANLPNLSHLYGNPLASRHTTLKSPVMHNYSMEADDLIHPVSRFVVPSAAVHPHYQNDLPPNYLYDGHVVGHQTPRAFHFSHPNAPDVLISPPPNPGHRGDTLRVPGSAVDIEPSPVTVFNNQCVPAVRFLPRYFRSPETTIDDDCIVPQPFLQPNVTSRTFMPSVDFSRIGPPSIQHPETFQYVRVDGHQNFPFAHTDRTPFSAILQHAVVPVPTFPTVSQGKNAPKPSKILMTFGAQVPSSERVPLSSVICGYLSSPRAETKAATCLGPQDPLKKSNFPNAPPKVPADVQNHEEKSGVNAKPVTSGASSIVEPGKQAIKIAVTAEGKPVLCPVIKYCTCGEAIKEKDKGGVIFVNQEKVKNSVSTGISTSIKDADRPQRITNASSPVECVVNPMPTADFSPRHLELARTKSLGLCTYTCSDTQPSTVAERSYEVRQPPGSPVIGALEFDLAFARGTSTTCIPEGQQERTRLQLVESGNIDTGSVCEQVKDRETPATNVKPVGVVEDISNSQAVSLRVQSSELLAADVSITEPYDEDSSANCDSTLNERYQHISDFRPSCTDSTTYAVSSSCQQSTKGKTSFTESMTTCLDATTTTCLDATVDHRVAALLESENSVNPRRRFRSLVASLDARRHIALQCGLAEQPRPANASESGFSKSRSSRISQSLEIRREHQQTVRHNDVCVQVPVLCCQSIETEPYTAEKGIPESRAGLSLRLMSTVVDVPPVVKMTESVGISTEDKPYEEGSLREEISSARISESKLPCELLVSTPSLKPPSPISVDYSEDCKGPLAPVPLTDKQLRRLKPFFKSRCCELANIYTLAAMHSVRLNTDSTRCSTSKEKLRPGSNTSNGVRKDKHPGSYYERNHSCDHEQTRRVHNQPVYDRRVALRRETSRMSPQSDSDDASCLHFEDEHSEHHRTSEFHGRSPNYKIDPPLAKDNRQSKTATSSSRRTCHSVDVDDRKHPRTGSREDKAGCRRKLGEPSKPARPSSKNVENANSLKRKPGCAVCKKDECRESKKKGILKCRETREKQTPDIRGSIMHFGLSNIVAPCRIGYGSPTVNTKEEINVNITFDEKSSPQQDLQTTREAARFKDDRVSIRDKFPKLRNTDSSASTKESNRTSSKSAVPTIFLTRAESNDVFGVGDPATSPHAPSMRIAVSSVGTTDTKPKDYSEGMPLRGFNSAVDVTVTQTAPPFVETRSKPKKNVEESSISNSKRLEHTPVETPSSGTPAKQVDTAIDDLSEQIKKDRVSIPRDRSVVDKQTSSSKLGEPVSIESKPIGSLDYLRPLRGCVFTAMTRYMKSHQRPEKNSDQPAYWNNKCPGFRFAGVSVTRNDCLPVGGRVYRDCCKCDPRDRGSSADFGLSVTRFPRSCTTDPVNTQKYDPTNACDTSSNASKTYQVRNHDSSDTRESNPTKTSPRTKIIWRNVLRKYKPNPLSPPAADRTRSLLEGHPPCQLIDSSKNLSDTPPTFKDARGVCCPEFSKCRTNSPEQTCSRRGKEGSVDKPIQAIRTLPPDMAAVEAFRMRYSRYATAFPESSVWARRRSRTLSAPAGEVRIRHGRCWPPDNSRGPRRLLHDHLRLPDDSFTCDRCQHRNARQRILAWVYDESPYGTDDEAFVVDDRDELEDEFRHNFCCPYRVSEKDHGV